MTQFNDYFVSLKLLEEAERKLSQVYEKLNPRQPLMRTRLVSLSRDLLCVSKLCGDSFMECVAWSVHTSEQHQKVNSSAKNLSFSERMELQVYCVRTLNDGEPLTRTEQEKFELLERIQSEYLSELSTAWKLDEDCGLRERIRDAETLVIANVRAFLFSCRSYQDAIYALYQISKGSQPNEWSSLNDGLGKAEFSAFIEKAPGYRDWFERMRDLRNLVKSGATAGVGLGGQQVVVSYDDARDNKAVKVGGNDFSFSDLSTSMSMSAKFTELVVNQ